MKATSKNSDVIHLTIGTDRMNGGPNACQDLKLAPDYIFLRYSLLLGILFVLRLSESRPRDLLKNLWSFVAALIKYCHSWNAQESTHN